MNQYLFTSILFTSMDKRELRSPRTLSSIKVRFLGYPVQLNGQLQDSKLRTFDKAWRLSQTRRQTCKGKEHALKGNSDLKDYQESSYNVFPSIPPRKIRQGKAAISLYLTLGDKKSQGKNRLISCGRIPHRFHQTSCYSFCAFSLYRLDILEFFSHFVVFLKRP